MDSNSQVEDKQLTEVAAGLIFRDEQLLIAQRHARAHLGGLWEFPGGKREPGETFEECLVRELMEELGVRVEVGALFQSVTHAYPEKRVHLRFYLCRLLQGEPAPLGCAAIRWVGRLELAEQAFPEADAALLQRLHHATAVWKGRAARARGCSLTSPRENAQNDSR